MALIFIEGFDKYSVPNSNSMSGTSGPGCTALLCQGDWTTAGANPAHTIVPGLSATGGALRLATAGGYLQRTLGANYSRLIGGIRFSSDLVQGFAIQLVDVATAQCSITVNAPAGNISVRNAGITGTILGTSTVNVTASSVHYLEWDITLGNASNYQLWLDGVSILTGTGDTTATANNYANAFSLTNGGGSPTTILDDLYLMDTSGVVNNAVLLTSPRIETSFPTSDAAVQFAFGAATLGTSTAKSTWMNISANSFRLRPVTPSRNCTLNSLGFVPGANNGAMNLRGVVYSDSAGLPGTLLTSGGTVTGATINAVTTIPLTTPQALVAGTQYWIGLMSDLAQTTFFYLADASGQGRAATVSFAGGAPSTAPGTSLENPLLVWGNVTNPGVNWLEVTGPPPQPAMSYVFDSVVGHEDLYNFAPLSTPPAAIYAVFVKAYCAKSDAGTRTVTMRTKSGAVDSAGAAAPQAMGTSFGWLSSYFPIDPATSNLWTPAGLNAAQSGFRIDS